MQEPCLTGLVLVPLGYSFETQEQVGVLELIGIVMLELLGLTGNHHRSPPKDHPPMEIYQLQAQVPVLAAVERERREVAQNHLLQSIHPELVVAFSTGHRQAVVVPTPNHPKIAVAVACLGGFDHHQYP